MGKRPAVAASGQTRSDADRETAVEAPISAPASSADAFAPVSERERARERDAGLASGVLTVAERASALFDACAAGILVFDREGTCIYASAPAVALFGAPAGIAPDELAAGAPPELRACVASALARGDEGHLAQCLVARRAAPSGETWVECWVRPNAGGAVLTLVDVSERRIADAEAAFRKILLTAQSDTSLDGILVVSPASEFISYNKRFIEMWGVPPHIVASKSDREALDMVLGKVVDPQQFIGKVQHLYTHPDEESHDQIALRDGRMFDRYSAPVRDAAGTHFGRVWFFRDVTERWRAEKEREEALLRAETERAAAEEASRAKDEFLAVVSHELRTPLTAVLGWARLLRCRVRTDAERERALGIIERNALLQVKLIEDLLDVSRVVTGKIRLNVGPIELGAIIGAAVESVQPAASAKGIRLSTTIAETAALITGDPERLQQVVFNLLSNAIKFTPEGGEVAVHLDRQDSFTEITIADDGVGIDPALLPHVFERFWQADTRPTTRAHGGLGLGLAIVRHLVELHGGSIAAESSGKGKGARFVVRLPVRALTAADRSDAPPRPRLSENPGGPTEHGMPDLDGVSVLFVDDDADARELLADLLGGCGAHVTTADTVEAALDAIARQHFDIIVSDISMPGKDGYDLVTLVRDAEVARGSGHVPAIALTAMASEASRIRAAQAGFDAHVTKPAEPIHLARVVAREVSRRA